VNVDALIVGAGPAGLAAAIELRRHGVERVLVADREPEAGGVPRHCAHTGFGLRDLRRILTGPAYASHYAAAAVVAGADLRCDTTVTQLTQDLQAKDLQAVLTSPAGIEHLRARAVLIATGCRERPRSARMIPGDRPSGVLTTGELQQRVLLGEQLPGRALIVGAEHVSFSAILTLSHAGARVVALVTDQPRHQSYAAFRIGALARWQVPVWASTRVSRISGRDKLESVEVTDMRTGSVRQVECHTLVFSGDWIADHELARMAGVAISRGTKGPAVDTALRTSVPGVFAAGNVIHAAETADVAALGGRHAGYQIAAFLCDRPASGGSSGSARAHVPIEVVAPLTWIAPNAIGPERSAPARNRFVLRSQGPRRVANLEVRQDGRLLAASRTRLMPARSITLSARWVADVNPAGGTVQVTAH
jgi:thioredoxin reductase